MPEAPDLARSEPGKPRQMCVSLATFAVPVLILLLPERRPRRLRLP